MNTRTYTAFTDGACLNNGNILARGGWGAVIRNADGETLEIAGPLDDGLHPTNQRAELTAAIEALKAVKNPSSVTLISSSNVVKGITEWLPGWKSKDWRKSDKKPVENADLWQQLDALLNHHQVSAQSIKGHSGHPDNERADALAARAAEFQKASRKRLPKAAAVLM
ncbi:ribonuclease HI [Pseudomonas seleniipraecipitans]|uniref:ribonuclease H n=1 Tax=Phytopseudomonas seleniipraecipitans TaxID=640205 RepID=A0ABY5JAE7_9GAMM|nr:ribonuclease H [Pseudomonas seleniipraecipitans]UUD64511.1 ribonuclease HI [Pseudomonas seleniipraecipitans]